MKSRSQKTVTNVVTGVLEELVAIACGLILPRLIIVKMGSDSNGITASITQFLSAIALLKGGIGGVTRAALYKPLAENNIDEVSAIVFQTEKFMRRIAIIFLASLMVFAYIYSAFICKEFSFWFEFSLVLIISFSTFVKYFFGLTYNMLLSADQKQNIIKYVSMATTVLNTAISVVLVNSGCSIHVVKAGSAIVFALDPFFVCWYAKKHYKLKRNVPVKGDYIKQRWDAVGHEVANFVNNSTDAIVLTIFTRVSEVSVYEVYHYVIFSIRKLVSSFIIGFGAAFGNMYAKKEYKAMADNIRLYELIVFSLASVIYAVSIVMICPFAVIYTADATDNVNYLRPLFAVIITLSGAFTCYRIPYQTVVTAVGKYRETRNGAFFEAGLNIVLSIVLVIKFGMVGVAIGTLAAAIFRSTQYAIYLSKYIIKRSLFIFINHVLLSLGIVVGTYLISLLYLPPLSSVSTNGYPGINGWFDWVVYAIITTAVAGILTVATNLLCYRKDSFALLKKLLNVLGKKKGKTK